MLEIPTPGLMGGEGVFCRAKHGLGQHVARECVRGLRPCLSGAHTWQVEAPGVDAKAYAKGRVGARAGLACSQRADRPKPKSDLDDCRADRCRSEITPSGCCQTHLLCISQVVEPECRNARRRADRATLWRRFSMVIAQRKRLPDNDAWSLPIEEIDVGRPELFQADMIFPYFERLRRDAPIHYCRGSKLYGPYWSVSCYQDIVEVEADHSTFSSDASLGGVTISDLSKDFMLPMFIAADPPKHTAQRAVVKPVMSHTNLEKLEHLLRERTRKVLLELPRGEVVDWVDRVSVELTTQLLATLFDFPWEDRRKLAWWSDVATEMPELPSDQDEKFRQAELLDCLAYFTRLWQERANGKVGADLISQMANSEATRNIDPMEYLGNLILLIVGGSDTVRNTISGGIDAMCKFPDEYSKLRNNPKLIQSAVPEIIRWQTPLAHMRRTATRDCMLYGNRIRGGEKVVLWYVSGNRDKSVIRDADKFIVDRVHPRKHLSFGFGIHRCVGERLGELQLRIFWEEMLNILPKFEVVAPPERVHSAFVRGYKKLLVRIGS
jgi:cytochrome P450